MALLTCGATLVQASPSELGLLTLSRAVVQALVSPVGGFLGETCFLQSSRPSPGTASHNVFTHSG